MKIIINIIKLVVLCISFILLWIFDLVISLITNKSIKSIWILETSVFKPIENNNGDITEFKLEKLGDNSLKETLINLKNKYL